VNNDGTHESTVILSGLKNIFQKQLPKMPRDYIARLVYDRTHLSMAIVKKPLEVVGGITYRPFKGRQFAEIVFCAISADQQVKGYGAHLMSHLKVGALFESISMLCRWVAVCVTRGGHADRLQGLRQGYLRCDALSHIRRQLCHWLLQEARLYQGDHTREE